ncbi:MAG: lysyl-tRNA synthetase class 2 [Granulosicoccus sp.]|jgi:lysyl-tRNA synthetase class 2
MSWLPNASLATLKEAAALRTSIRQWMEGHDVLEVCTPALSRHATTDPHVPSIGTSDGGYLHTSPEFPMKRLLAAHAQDPLSQPDIYQIASVFRAGESGQFHNTEFSLLEWYRVGMNHHDLMVDAENLLQHVWTNFSTVWPGLRTLRYGVEIRDRLGVWPEAASAGLIERHFRANGRSYPASIGMDVDAALDLFMDEFVLPTFSDSEFTLVKDYPVSQAALARLGLDEDGRKVAERFEIYFGKTELANGFHELSDSDVQRARFMEDLEMRQIMAAPLLPMDTYLLDALAEGLPDCAGIALGLDRLLMVLGKYERISQVLSFDDQRA